MPPVNKIREAFQKLSQRVEGEVRDDKLSRLLYSSDASIYQVEPYGVVLPRHGEDIVQTLKIAQAYGMPVIARAGGTSLAGQCVGEGIILDVSKYMNRILEIDAEARWVRVQPGVIQDELSRAVAPYGMHFGPDTSTSNRAMIGGMIGNNSCGARSIYYGKTVDHTLEMDVILSDGSKATFKDLSPEELEQKQAQDDLEGQIYREVCRILEVYGEEIEARYPKILRRNTGYLLDELLDPDRPFNLSRLICGSEGTLALIVEARVKIVERPQFVGLMAIQCGQLRQALDATVVAIQQRPAAVELIDDVILDLARDIRATQHLRFFLEGEPEAILAVEFFGRHRQDVEAQMDALEAPLVERGLGYAWTRLWGEDMDKVWALRKAGLGILMGMPGDSKPATFVEDTAVPPERLPEFIDDFREVMRKHDTHCCYYGHASVGELHMRPILNLKSAEDRKKLALIADEVAELVGKYGGSISGEHGDGRVRSPFLERFFGASLFQAHKELKAAFDPHHLLNPHKIIDALPMLTDLRTPEHPIEVQTVMSFAQEQGYLRAAEYCNGAGACRKTHLAKGSMCPSYQATLEETHSTRGRANLLRTVLASDGPVRAFINPDLHEAMELCLECKACKNECPSNVDLAKLKYEFLQKRHDMLGAPLHVFAFGHIALANKINEPLAPLFNGFARSRWGKWLAEKLLHVDRRRSLPHMVTPSLRSWFFSHPLHPNAGKNGKTVTLFADAFTNYNEPQIGRDAVLVLEALGYDVALSPIEDDGRALISKGFLRKARRLARRNRLHLQRLLEDDRVLIGLEPSTLLTFRDEYLDLFPDDPIFAEAAKRCLMIDEFLVRERAEGAFEPPFLARDKRVLLHGHCMQKALSSVKPTLEMLQMVPGLDASAIPSGCCGMAGSFGYEVGKYEVSMKIGELVLFPAVRSRGDAQVVATGTSCRHQLHDGLHYDALHPIQLLAEALPPITDPGPRRLPR